MLIESLIKRKNGTKVLLNNPDIEYHFKPKSDKEGAAHVADVTEKSHVATFLAIPHGFAVYDESLKETKSTGKQTKSANDGDSEPELKGSSFKPEVVEYGNGNSVKTSALIDTAFKNSGMTAEEWNKQTNAQIKETLSNMLDALNKEEAAKTEAGNDDGKDGGEGDTPKLDNTNTPEPKKSKAEKQAEFKARKAELGQN